ncbi:ABC-type transport system substrate-binding protein [Inhella inkyongensis]|uniref:ABC-type transport system substrate-binding protein n=1 Tax=Inhella inkyongensis TaxID=392593 RepID=A0A840S207_9BURK|nr:ABC transporter substrate-binding protein [Inhella inkyongensis]MBB5202711.1 ABC-type transport system substrate-binding protein [Inhella inkyongensis]
MQWMQSVAVAVALVVSLGAQAQEAGAKKTLRYSFRVAETGFDPAKINDLYSRTITPHIFEALVTYDHLARPVKLKALTAVELPTPNADFTVWTAKIRPGIYFQDAPAFGGKPRELVAADYAYSFKRFADPKNAAPAWTTVEAWGLTGLLVARERAIKTKQPFDYDAPMAGLQVLDRYTLRIQLDQPNPRFLQEIALSDIFGAVAREVIEADPETTMERPVGTGPFKLMQWRRGSFIALERNPGYRERYYDAQPGPDDAEGQALLEKFKGRRIPMIDRVEISILAEDQPRWLSFLRGEQDFLERVPEPFYSVAAPKSQLAPNLVKQGMKLHRTLASDVFLMFFNMEDAVVGGLSPEKVALRRAISLAMDSEREIRLVRGGQAIPAQGTHPPHTAGYRADYKSHNSEYDPAKAKALLDTYGYVDADGDGCRDAPGGGPLKLEMATTPEGIQRQVDELFNKDMKRIGLCIPFKTAKWPEQLKAARGGKLQMWMVAYSSAQPDGLSAASRLASSHAGGNNIARFSLPEVDRAYEQLRVMPDGPERQALFERVQRLGNAFMPYKFKGHRYHLDIERVQMSGYRRPGFSQHWWEYVDIDMSKAKAP